MLDVGHAKLAHRSYGTGPDLVFVHGWPLHSDTFRHVAPLVARHFTVHLIDMPGAGLSTYTKDTHFGLKAHAATLRNAIDQLGLERYLLVGHDSGAGIARFLAASDERVVGVLSGPTEIPGHLSWLVSMYKLVAHVPGGLFTIQTLLGVSLVRRSFLGFSGCFRDPNYVEGDFKRLFIDPLTSDARVLRPQLEMLKSFKRAEIDTLEQVHNATTSPVRFVLGDADTIFPLGRARSMPGQYGGEASLHVIPGAKAFLHEDHPDAFAAQVMQHADVCFQSAALA
jgi:pimeloyl-ACP methyl ester carboxylesterase